MTRRTSGCGLGWCQGNVSDGVQIHTYEEAILRAKRGQSRTCLGMSCSR